MAILRKKAAAFQVELREDLVAYLAQHVRTNIRRSGGGPDEGDLLPVPQWAGVFKGGRGEPAPGPFVGRYQKTSYHRGDSKQVAEHFGVRLVDMTEKRRNANMAFPRQVAMYLARQYTTASLQEIGETFGGSPSRYGVHACKALSLRMKNEDQIRQTMVGIGGPL